MYILHRWNGRYGNNAKFVVENKVNGKFAEFAPARPRDIAWVDKDLSNVGEYKGWEDFQKEEVDDLSKIIM